MGAIVTFIYNIENTYELSHAANHLRKREKAKKLSDASLKNLGRPAISKKVVVSRSSGTFGVDGSEIRRLHQLRAHDLHRITPPWGKRA